MNILHAGKPIQQMSLPQIIQHVLGRFSLEDVVRALQSHEPDHEEKKAVYEDAARLLARHAPFSEAHLAEGLTAMMLRARSCRPEIQEWLQLRVLKLTVGYQSTAAGSPESSSPWQREIHCWVLVDGSRNVVRLSLSTPLTWPQLPPDVRERVLREGSREKTFLLLPINPTPPEHR